MKKNKKFWGAIISFALMLVIVPCAAIFAACGGTTEKEGEGENKLEAATYSFAYGSGGDFSIDRKSDGTFSGVYTNVSGYDRFEINFEGTWGYDKNGETVSKLTNATELEYFGGQLTKSTQYGEGEMINMKHPIKLSLKKEGAILVLSNMSGGVPLMVAVNENNAEDEKFIFNIMIMYLTNSMDNINLTDIYNFVIPTGTTEEEFINYLGFFWIIEKNSANYFAYEGKLLISNIRISGIDLEIPGVYNPTVTYKETEDGPDKTVVLKDIRVMDGDFNPVGSSIPYAAYLKNDAIDFSLNNNTIAKDTTLETFISGKSLTFMNSKTGEKVDVPLTAEMFEEFDLSTTGKKVITISYEGAETKFVLDVYEGLPENHITKIEGGVEEFVAQGSSLVLGTLYVYYADGTTKNSYYFTLESPTSGGSTSGSKIYLAVTGYDANKVGFQEITLTLTNDGKPVSWKQTIYVYAPEEKIISGNINVNNAAYAEGKLTGTYTLYYKDGTNEQFNLSNENLFSVLSEGGETVVLVKVIIEDEQTGLKYETILPVRI